MSIPSRFICALFFMNALKFLSHVEPESWEKNLKSYAGSNPDKLHAIYYGMKT